MRPPPPCAAAVRARALLPALVVPLVLAGCGLRDGAGVVALRATAAPSAAAGPLSGAGPSSDAAPGPAATASPRAEPAPSSTQARPGPRGTSAPRPEPGWAASLTGVDWQLHRLVEGGSALDVAHLDATLRFTRDRVGGVTCNSFGGHLRVDGDRARMTDASSTAMACSGELARAEAAVHRELADARWERRGDRLLLEGRDGTRLEYAPRDAVYPSRTLVSLQEGRRGPGLYRLGWEAPDDHVSLVWEHRPAADSGWEHVATSALRSEPVRHLEPMTARVADGEGFVLGFAMRDAARVVFAARGSETDLRRHPIPDAPRWWAFGGFVPRAEGGQVVAYDAQGEELARSRPLPF